MSTAIPATPPELERVLHELVFAKWDAEFLESDAARRAIDDVVFARFHNALRYSIPWLSGVIDLKAATVVEIGCGSGSSTAALALNCAHVVGVDIDEDSVRAAAARCAAYHADNVTLHAVSPAEMLDRAASTTDPDVCVLYAVLEHQTYDERLTTLRTLWDRLPTGGHLVIVETPNRFAYMDHHTSELPFFHLLPDTIAFEYLDRVPRLAFRDTLARTLRDHPADAPEQRIRWGLGVSYHEFELALGEPLDGLVVADGYEQEMVDFFPIGIDEELLTRYFIEAVPDIPMGFSRAVLNLVLRKPRSDTDRAAAAEANTARRQEIAHRIRPVDGPPSAPALPPDSEAVAPSTAARAALSRVNALPRRVAGR
jgi:2-polyprenyl-3-methyl-5-hydroxy-6-metoxy-1,4-benzoquinol methylase